ncbi:type I DNA topoisomerase [Wolbachia endosymbiont of Brugia malayi]|uniref:type I DNA topoisomerase n=1 Tax=Wolbachia endosymbiont of Brugia malayi TaxID=80849 RepID=UPI00004C9236|nr:type I DNA topoisomerase [Wolbachia endosymbiont of Brugia malayi]AAW70629.1 Topoisomerase IA, TopA [Wolbachia endosymbiont strain TRS of Brugia malayi]QCB61616.1 type I DNA topoisomerase [Wolbachia endosymbiont of Brugia malayi]
MALLIVESPAKARTISKYLSKEFKVAASFGHVRDLPVKNGSVDPDNDFAIKYEIIEKAEKYVKELVKEASQTSDIYLATDPDREGEAIAWNVIEALKERKAINDKSNIYRVVFNEITKRAVQEAVKNPREINMDLVRAQQARRALDYLVGFSLSPLLWTKLSGSKSAGRVQSVALKLICEREDEISKFVSQEYWSIRAEIKDSKGETFFAMLSHYDNKKLEKFDIKNEEEAKGLVKQIESRQYAVSTVERKQVKRNPLPPFITSSLQQDAVNKLYFNVKNVMRIAQDLYEGIDIGGETVGLITYMRTDGFYIADEAVNSIRRSIKSLYGNKYLPKSSRQYVKKVKNAQEAHEAIRPTDIDRTPDSIKDYLTPEQFKLYGLIWKRTIASQMESAILDQVVVEISSTDQKVILRASGSIIFFDGFYKVYKNNVDGEDESMIPTMKEGEECKLISVDPEQHFTQPPSRYSEASIVKKMEEIGIGRPSTYAAIISVLQDREYVTLDNKRFIPSSRGKIVTIFLETFFQRCVEYDFTAQMEEKLDLISNGRADWKKELGYFWVPFFNHVNSVKQMTHDEIFNGIRDLVVDWFCSEEGKKEVNKKCPDCPDGILKLNFGKAGVFLGCSNYPTCTHTKEITGSNDNSEYPKSLGIDGVTEQEVVIKKGPFGLYLEFNSESEKKKTVSIPKDINVNDIDLSTATRLLSLPKVIGEHPETGKEVKIGLGRFGYYIFYDSKYFSLKKSFKEVLEIQLDEAVQIIANSPRKELKSLGFNEKGKEVFICNGRYGFYIKCGKTNVALGKNADIESVDLRRALELIKSKK